MRRPHKKFKERQDLGCEKIKKVIMFFSMFISLPLSFSTHSEPSILTHPPDMAAPAVHKGKSFKIDRPNGFKSSADGFN